METMTKKEPQIRVSRDNMQAYLYLPNPVMDAYTEREVREALEKSGVSYGIQEDALNNVLENQLYNREILIAQGDRPKDGVDGYYEYKFDVNFSKKPKLCPDGSVDYWSIKMVEIVTEGQEIAVYHKAVPGVDGMNLKGKPVLAKRGRDLVPLRGKGFERSEDGTSYISLMDGKIEKSSDRITILPVYEVSGDVDLSIGNIDFRGDVIVHGTVCSGVTVKATGTVTVDGVVEGAKIEAGKDIVLRSGVMGASRAVITTRGNISAKFFEYTRVHANGSIRADVFLNCQVSCGESILLDGKKASIVGGEVGAIQGIVVNTLGSDGEVRTHVRIGNDSSVRRRIGILRNKIEVEKANLEKIENGLKLLKDVKNDPRRTDLLRVKIRDTALLAEDTAELEKLEDQMERARGCTVRVIGCVYPGVSVEIDDLEVHVKEEQFSLEFIRQMDKIVMCAL
ncbi:hypothetical protein C805_02841 [Eubacterium sp. 14-2]|uniref:DUF342 domain-containing protein n=1 Tax=Eubacterium sp. 14-2 TaxID=1235790 RepID=UPI00033904AB|nr:FapA family protein [Eubacterium sp. 14-2]EOT24629.1 hypothetical protein C805_02841 [Eubacterium sp. 14-2]